jgi:hypothetical protein
MHAEIMTAAPCITASEIRQHIETYGIDAPWPTQLRASIDGRIKQSIYDYLLSWKARFQSLLGTTATLHVARPQRTYDRVQQQFKTYGALELAWVHMQAGVDQSIMLPANCRLLGHALRQ